jgi:hypothetical protein
MLLMVKPVVTELMKAVKSALFAFPPLLKKATVCRIELGMLSMMHSMLCDECELFT